MSIFKQNRREDTYNFFSVPNNVNLGFTLIETLLAISIISILSISFVGVSSNILTGNNLQDTTDQITGLLHEAQTNTIAGKTGNDWSVNISSSQVTLYKGDSFSGHNPSFDQSFDIPSSTTVTPLTITFQKPVGTPAATATIQVSNSNGSRIISVNEEGVVDVQ